MSPHPVPSPSAPAWVHHLTSDLHSLHLEKHATVLGVAAAVVVVLALIFWARRRSQGAPAAAGGDGGGWGLAAMLCIVLVAVAMTAGGQHPARARARAAPTPAPKPSPVITHITHVTVQRIAAGKPFQVTWPLAAIAIVLILGGVAVLINLFMRALGRES